MVTLRCNSRVLSIRRLILKIFLSSEKILHFPPQIRVWFCLLPNFYKDRVHISWTPLQFLAPQYPYYQVPVEVKFIFFVAQNLSTRNSMLMLQQPVTNNSSFGKHSAIIWKQIVGRKILRFFRAWRVLLKTSTSFFLLLWPLLDRIRNRPSRPINRHINFGTNYYYFAISRLLVIEVIYFFFFFLVKFTDQQIDFYDHINIQQP